MVKHLPNLPHLVLQKVKTGIQGFDEITLGGLPKDRTTLVCGGAGCGKTLFALEFVLNGITKFNEPGVIIAFEENDEELAQNVASLGFNLTQLIKEKKLSVDYIKIDKSELVAAGEYSLDALFVRLKHAITQIKAKRVALDTIEVLFSTFEEQNVIRMELRRLFRWLKEQKVTTVLTGEKGEGSLTRYGFEEYVSDCVIFLDHRVINQLSTRRLRIIKYRGSQHGTNEYPFLINNKGVSVLPITSVGLEYAVGNERVSTGIKALDGLFDGKGYYKGSTILISGTAGTGKSSIASLFADAACGRGEKCLYFAFEESASQIIRNMESIGINFTKWVNNGLLKICTSRPTVYGLEMHLVMMHEILEEFKPNVVILDPISNLISQGDELEVKALLLRIIDYLKIKNVTTLLTNLTSQHTNFEQIEINVSSIADTWIMLRHMEEEGELQRGIFIIKSRGMSHSNKIKPYMITNSGIAFVEKVNI